MALGLIGVGPSWERRYRAAVRHLSQRMCIRVVHDPVLSRAQAAAQETGAEVVAGLKQVLDHPGLQGVLVLDAGWYGLAPIEFACDRQRPAFLAGKWQGSPSDWQRWHEVAQARGVMLVPELSWRFQPATSRLRELIASRLGPVRRLSIGLPSPAHEAPELLRHQLAAAVDWCGYVTRQTVASLNAVGQGEGDFQVVFRPDLRGGELAPAQIVFGKPFVRVNDNETAHFHATVECEQGVAMLEGASTLRWITPQTPEICEQLDQERTEEVVMLDQFCRRLVGGLIPTASLGDVATALHHLATLGH